MEGFWTPGFGRGQADRPLLKELPADVVVIDDTGAAELAVGEFSGLRLSAAAIAQVQSYDPARELLRENTCTAPSVALAMQAPFAIEIYQGRDLIVFKLEYFDLFRVVFLDGRGHPPPAAPHSKPGHSIGHFEGDTLVVDTTHVAAGSFMNNGFDHSDRIHIVERFRLSADGSRLAATQVYEDPAVFSGKAARYIEWRRVPGEYVYPYDCDPSYGR